MGQRDSIEQRLFSNRTRFLRRCVHCGSWFRFTKSREVGISTITSKRLWKSLPRYDCMVCGDQHQNYGF